LTQSQDSGCVFKTLFDVLLPVAPPRRHN